VVTTQIGARHDDPETKASDYGILRNVTDDDVPIRDRLPIEQGFRYTFEDDETDVRLQYYTWPDVRIVLRPLGRGTEIEGVTRPDGRISSITIKASSDADEVTGGAARSLSAIVTAIKEWNAVARDLAEQLLANPDARTAIDPKPATDSLRALFYDVPRGPGTRKRGADAELLLRQVAQAYTDAIRGGDPTPRKTVAEQFGYTPEHISRLLRRAREARNGRPPLLADDATLREGR
jgi:hypothetical protein